MQQTGFGVLLYEAYVKTYSLADEYKEIARISAKTQLILIHISIVVRD